MSKRLIGGTAGLKGRNIFISPSNSSMREMSYGRIRLDAEQSRVRFTNDGQETGLVCLSGAATVTVGEQHFELGAKDALYVSKGLPVTVETTAAVDLVECSAVVEGEYPVQFVPYASVKANEKLHFVAGNESSKREINIMLGTNVQAGRLVVGVTSSLPGNWTSWPPHEHAAMLEEIYVFFDMPEPAFGLQLVYTDGISAAEVEVVRDGDAVLLPEGYHPNVAIPGSELNFVWMMAAHREVVDRQWGVVTVDARFA
ncbi:MULTISPECIES: 5-deoxy-glucuronate isomerase [Acidobacteriaceae]|uniref:5-deoxy-glucuronate isomerase n=1 Tax=Acidobacteriaceae TaxID=204434 RepID=UPI00131DAA84|nr:MULTISPECIES: 5-deoxy-glucuronate isomerase [Acidobacteriaceae]MDW5267040.1 5-deoxy-glucuronate isomerase [Edaphobacter sp.]